MSEAILEFTAESREQVGKGASRRLRREAGLIPAIVYGAGKPPVKLTLEHNEMFKAIEHEAFFSSILTLHIDGKSQQVILKDLQRHPAKPIILHADFMRISAKKCDYHDHPIAFSRRR